MKTSSIIIKSAKLQARLFPRKWIPTDYAAPRFAFWWRISCRAFLYFFTHVTKSRALKHMEWFSVADLHVVVIWLQLPEFLSLFLSYLLAEVKDSGSCSQMKPSWKSPIECHNTKTKVFTLTNHKGHRHFNEPIKTWSFHAADAKRGKTRKARENICERVATGLGLTSDWMIKRREFFLSQSGIVVDGKPISFRHSIENRSLLSFSSESKSTTSFEWSIQLLLQVHFFPSP